MHNYIKSGFRYVNPEILIFKHVHVFQCHAKMPLKNISIAALIIPRACHYYFLFAGMCGIPRTNYILSLHLQLRQNFYASMRERICNFYPKRHLLSLLELNVYFVKGHV